MTEHTILDALANLARNEPERVLFTWLPDGEVEGDSITCAELARRSEAFARSLVAEGLSDRRLLLLFAPGIDFLVSLIGCFHARCIAVPIAVPTSDRDAQHVRMLCGEVDAPAILTTTKLAADHQAILAEPEFARNVRWLCVDELPLEESGVSLPAIGPSEIAYLQYTSGSTATPKGVIVTHANVMANCRSFEIRFALEGSVSLVSWLPHFHDMGLITGYFCPLVNRARVYAMPPGRFTQKPIRWLRAISKYQAWGAVGPNFAFDLCVARTSDEERKDLDLSSWKFALTGAEVVRAETLERFAETFEPFGFDRNALCPAYGLAESTLAVTATAPKEPFEVRAISSAALQAGRVEEVPPDRDGAMKIVSCGTPMPGALVRIVDPDGRPSPDGSVGEIWTSGPSVSPGYWGRPGLTLQHFRVGLGTEGDGQYLRTGDLGFLLEGRLFCTGRLKELIIVRGKNHYPADIEKTVSLSHPSVAEAPGAAFSVLYEGEERVVVAQEIRRTARRSLDGHEVTRAIRSAVAQAHQLQLHAVLLVRPTKLPKTTSGKVQRKRARDAYLAGALEVQYEEGLGEGAPHSAADPVDGEVGISERDVVEFLLHWLSETAGIPLSDLDPRLPFSSYGLDSLKGVELTAAAGEYLRRSLPETLAVDYPTAETLAHHLVGGDPSTAPEGSALTGWSLEPIAVIGVGCRFPGGVDGPESFWELLEKGRDVVSLVPADRWNVDAFYDQNPGTPGKMVTRWGGFLENIADFDEGFFGIAPREALSMDPQQRLLLEVSWEAIERAGLTESSLTEGSTGVFIGMCGSEYANRSMHGGVDQSGEQGGAVIDAYSATGSAASVASGRLAYSLGLTGPAITVDTACSSSLVAVHLACQALRAGECDIGLTGGVNVILDPERSIALSQLRALSPTGRCRAFSDDGDGYVRAEGCGIVVLKRLSDAQRDGDPILATIRGSAVNQDGRSQGLAAPNGPAQQEVIRLALRHAGVAPADIDYVETHGTGTPLGDPIEVQALAEVLAEERDPDRPVVIGSVKSNVGHLEAAAGIAGFIKTVVAIQHEMIPPTLHSAVPNSRVPWSEIPVSLAQSSTPWRRPERTRYAGVSSFGFSGTNAHVIVEEPPAQAIENRVPESANSSSRPAEQYLIPISCHSAGALDDQLDQIQSYVSRLTTPDISDMAYTLSCRRSTTQLERLALVASTSESFADRARSIAEGSPDPMVARGRAGVRGDVAFVFPGQGSQWVGMGRALIAEDSSFANAMMECEAALDPHLSWRLRDLFVQDDRERLSLDRLDVVQPALFAIAYSLAAVWRAWGVEPQAVIGHSQGEIAAACVAGCLSLEDAALVVSRRSRLLRRVDGRGGMAFVQLTLSETVDRLSSYGDRLSVAASNSESSTVVSGENDALAALLASLESDGIFSRPISANFASHSSQMDPLRDELIAALAPIKPRSGVVPFYSTTAGSVLDGSALTAEYWMRNLRDPVQFLDGTKQLLDAGVRCFVEISPSPILAGTIDETLSLADCETVVVPSLRRDSGARDQLLSSLGALYVRGYEVDWQKLYPRPSAVAPLPTYPFQRTRYWLESSRGALRVVNGADQALLDLLKGDDIDHVAVALGAAGSLSVSQSEALPGVLNAISVYHARMAKGEQTRSWFYQRMWRRAKRRSFVSRGASGTWLLLADEQGIGEKLGGHLEAAGGEVLLVVGAPAGSVGSPTRVHVDRRDTAAVREAISDLVRRHGPLRGVVCTWGLDLASIAAAAGPDRVMKDVVSVLDALQAVVALELDEPPRCWLVTQGAVGIDSERRPPCPEQAILSGMGRVFGLEHPDHWGGTIELDPTLGASVVDDLATELCVGEGCDDVALSGTGRFVERLVPHVPMALRSSPDFAAGTVLITGGTGRYGANAAVRLVTQHGVRSLVLVSRRGSAAPRAAELQETLEALGARVRIESADVTNRDEMKDVLDRLRRDGELVGIIHAASVMEPRLFMDQTPESMTRSLASAVWGAKIIDELTAEMPVSAVIHFSPVTGVAGSEGFVGNASASAFLNAWAGQLDQPRRRVQSLSWGPWPETDPKSALAVDAFVQRGIRPLDPDLAMSAFDIALREDAAHLAIADVDWGVLSEFYAGWDGTSHFSELVSQSGALPSVSEEGTGFVLELRGLPETKRVARLESRIQEEVATVLGYGREVYIEASVGFFDLGMDSLMALQLRNRLQHLLQLRVSAAALFSHPTSESLASYLAGLLATADLEDVGPSIQSEADEEAGFEELSLTDEEVDEALANELAELEALLS